MTLYIGDTPEQLGSCLTADAMMIDGKVVTKADYLALVTQVGLLNAQMVKMQKRSTLYLQPDGESDHDFINYILGVLDGPEQRLAQSTPNQCLREIQAEAIETLIPKCTHSTDHGVKIITESMIKYRAERIRKGDK